MYTQLILKCFNKAETETRTDVLTKLATHIAEILLEDHKFQVNERTLRNYYKGALKTEAIDIKISHPIAKELSKYLGYKNLGDFFKSLGKKNRKPSIEKMTIGCLLVVIFYFGLDVNQPKCMIWKGDHYEEISCEIRNAKPINNERPSNFKKVNINGNPLFFKDHGASNPFYGKSVKEDYQHFLILEIYPIIKEPFRPISKD